MFRNRRFRPIHAILGGVVVTATVVPFAASALAAAPMASKPAAGIIHIYLANTSLSSTTPNTVLITGAFSDHGTGNKGTWTLTKGTITFNTSKLKAITNSPKFGTFNPASCSFNGEATAPITIVGGGTGAYAGIKGTLTATQMGGEQGALLKNGKCNEANNAPAVAQINFATAFGKVSF